MTPSYSDAPLADLLGWWIEVRCRCGLKLLPVRLLLRRHAGRTAAEVALRLRCARCRQRPGETVLVDDPQLGAPGYVSHSGRQPIRIALPIRAEEDAEVCNLYRLTTPQAAMRELAKVRHDRTGNLPPLPGIFPDTAAPIVREGAEGRELVLARWGMPSPEFALGGKRADRGVTNIRNTASAHWRRWLGPEHRCLVPLDAFAENETRPDGSKPPVWFALAGETKLAFFAGIWTRWTSVRKLKEGEVTADLFGFLTTEPNAEVAPIHPKAMPVILTTAAQIECWLAAPAKEALRLQRPLPDGSLVVQREQP